MILATNNQGKLKEIKEIFSEYQVSSLKEKGIDVDVNEDQDTFLGNAKKKAKEIYEISSEETIADDSGLCISALNGFPGVMTHRFLGDEATDKMRNEYLIQEVNKYNDRSAQVVCSLAYYDGQEFIEAEGVLDGFISTECRGDNGFGFDEIFELPNGFTLAQLSSDEKNEVSARAIAVKVLKEKIENRNI